MSAPLEKLRRLRAAIVAKTEATAPTAPMASYLAKVAERAYAIEDGEVRALLEGGVDQDEIFERTIGAALGAAIHRFDAGLRALSEEEKSR